MEKVITIGLLIAAAFTLYAVTLGEHLYIG